MRDKLRMAIVVSVVCLVVAACTGNDSGSGSGSNAGADASTVAPNRASDINPADIESIQILKSAAASDGNGASAATAR